MAPRPVPVTMGSPRFRTREVGAFHVTEAWFPPRALLPPHVHDRAVFGVMLEGSFDHLFTGRMYDCTPDTILTEPAGERHANRMERLGAHVLILQPDPTCAELLHPVRSLLEEIHNIRHPGVAHLAWRLARELQTTDTAAPLAVEAGALEMLAVASRQVALDHAAGVAPKWLARARELVEERYRERLQIAEIAREVGIHPAHLARAFRERYREPIAGFMRRRRLEWAAAQLLAGEEPLSAIAHRAGFADQSHFTRSFKAWSRMTPAAYRKAHAVAVDRESR